MNIPHTPWTIFKNRSDDRRGANGPFRFPQTDQQKGKLRQALVIRRVPGQYDDWLVCMISSRLDQEITRFDEVLRPGDADFEQSGLKVASLVRVGRLAVVNVNILVGRIGEIDAGRLLRIKRKLAEWLVGG